jgi:hypothetical protein
MAFRARYFLIGLVALIAAAGLIGWHFFGGRGEVLKPDGGPVVTVMNFGPARSIRSPQVGGIGNSGRVRL